MQNEARADKMGARCWMRHDARCGTMLGTTRSMMMADGMSGVTSANRDARGAVQWGEDNVWVDDGLRAHGQCTDKEQEAPPSRGHGSAH